MRVRLLPLRFAQGRNDTWGIYFRSKGGEGLGYFLRHVDAVFERLGLGKGSQSIYACGISSMLGSVSKKLEMARYFLNNLKSLADEAGGFAHIGSSKRIEADANLDGFFFELISAKDFFLQEVNRKFKSGLKSKEVSEDNLLSLNIPQNAKEQVKKIKAKLSDVSTWLWRINNYRNVATHRRLFQWSFVANSGAERVKVYLLEDPDEPEKGNSDIEIIPYCEGALKQMTEFLEGLYSHL